MTPSLEEAGITLNLLGETPIEEKYIVLQHTDWNSAVQMALQCRRTHPDEPIELVPKGDLWTVVRCVKKL